MKTGRLQVLHADLFLNLFFTCSETTGAAAERKKLKHTQTAAIIFQSWNTDKSVNFDTVEIF